MMSRGTAGKVARPEELASLLALAPGLPGPWFTRGAHIALAPVVVRAANTDWIVDVLAYADRNRTNPREVKYAVILTMFSNKAPRTERGRSQMRAWQRRITKQLRALGYEGRWQQRAAGGPLVAYFSKDVARLALIPPAVRKLQRVRF
jgi:hypothetical protein